MCIIMVKPAGEGLPDAFLIKRCFNKNPDGAGIMFRDKGRVNIQKGFMNPGALIETLDWLEEDVGLKDRDVCFHFRMATHGWIIPECTHPFPISDNVDDLTSLVHTCDAAIMHNGILYRFAPRGKGTLSDTMVFVREMAKNGYDEKKGFMISNGRGQKFALITVDHIYIFGDFIYDQGFYFSNNSYL